MGVNAATIYRIERGERADISRPQLDALVRALEISEAELLSDQPVDSTHSESNDGDLAALREQVEEMRGLLLEVLHYLRHGGEPPSEEPRPAVGEN